MLETDADGDQTARNVYGTNLLMRTSGSDTVFYMYNGHADVTALLDDNGNIKVSYYYDAFGNILETHVGTQHTSVNLAIGKTVTVSSAETSEFIGTNAIDGNQATRWSSVYSDPQWICVDLGTIYSINEVKLVWEAYGEAYKIQVSDNGIDWTDVYSTENGDGGTDDICFNAINARYVRMYGIQRGTSWGYSLFEFEVYGDPAVVVTNLAINKTVTASSAETSEFIGTNAIDGNQATRWSSVYSDPQWICVDLGTIYSINEVKLVWEAYGEAYKIQVSDNGIDWTDVYSTENGDGGTDDINFNAINVRYVRMYGIQRGTPWGYSLFEFKIYGCSQQVSEFDNPFRYAGYQYDKETGLYYLNSRMYDAKTARFLQQDDPKYGDPNDPLSLNYYTYCKNSPITYVDPTGHWSQQEKEDAIKAGWSKKDISEMDRLTDQYNDAAAALKKLEDDYKHKKVSKSKYEDQKDALLGKEKSAHDSADVIRGRHKATNDFSDKGSGSGNKSSGSSSGNSSSSGSNNSSGATIGPASGPTIGPAQGPTITSGTPDPITQAGIDSAKEYLNSIIDEYHPYEWPSGYSIGDYTWGAEYQCRYQEEVDRAKKIAAFFNTLDLANNIRTSYTEANEVTGGNPGLTATGTVVFTLMKELWDAEPGIGDLPEALGINSSINKNISKALEKSVYIDNSDYKYLVYSGQFLWEKGPRGMFIDNITSLESDISKKTYTIYDTEKENAAYKKALLEYLERIKKMNINYSKSVSDMKFSLSLIDDKYK